MNFLYRTTQPAAPELPRISEQDHHRDALQKPTTTLEGLIADDSYQPSSTRSEDGAANNGSRDISGDPSSLDSKSLVPLGTHADVAEDEGWITIPCSSVPLTCSFRFFVIYHKGINTPMLFINQT
jgi:hypothetical protein